MHRDGDFMDIGCANGLLLESIQGWTRFDVRPHGIDFIEELVDLARSRFPGCEAHFEVANAFHWQPQHTYDFVRTELVYVPAEDRAAYVERLIEHAVAPGGRLIVCVYGGTHRAADEELRALG